MRLPIFLDTDPGIDDAIATTAVIFVPELDLQLMTTVTDNVSVEKTTRNALQLLHFRSTEIPLTQGVAMPLVRASRDAVSVCDESGMAGHDFVEHNRKSPGAPAFLATWDALMRALGLVTLVVIGPLTNTALLLSQCPECRSYTRHLVIMDGFAGRGNCTPNVEFNIAADPEAVACVFRSGIEIAMCGLDVIDQAMLTPDYLSTSPQLNRTGKVFHALLSHYRGGSTQSGLRTHDLCVTAWLVRPNLFTLKPCFVAAETQGEFTSGATVVDIDGCLGKPANVQMALGLDVKGFQQWVAEVLALAS